MCTGLQYIYVSTCVPCSLLRFDIKLGFTPRPVLLLLSAREAIFNQTWSTSYLCLATPLTKFKGFLVIVVHHLLPSVPLSSGLLEFSLLRFSPEGWSVSTRVKNLNNHHPSHITPVNINHWRFPPAITSNGQEPHPLTTSRFSDSFARSTQSYPCHSLSGSCSHFTGWSIGWLALRHFLLYKLVIFTLGARGYITSGYIMI